eukprot:7161744-Ditylum_brightwellii.AAC.1
MPPKTNGKSEQPEIRITKADKPVTSEGVTNSPIVTDTNRDSQNLDNDNLNVIEDKPNTPSTTSDSQQKSYKENNDDNSDLDLSLDEDASDDEDDFAA